MNTLSFDPKSFANLRPLVYHITHQNNVPRLRKLGIIQPASEILRLAKQEDLIRKKRNNELTIAVDTGLVTLNDQVPLNFTNVQLNPGWREEDVVAYVNEHVFFWPGDNDGPKRMGARFGDHYSDKQRVALRVATEQLFRLNEQPLFCPYNFGAPRKQHGAAVLRGRDLFQSASRFTRTEGKVVELAFRSTVHLPRCTEVSTPSGVWTSLWEETG